MTEEINNDLTALKEKATLMGIKFHPASGAKSIQEKIDAKLNSNDEEQTPVVKTAPVAETQQQMSVRIKKEATALIRCRITCMNPNKTEWDGEIFCVGNSVIPTIKKMVPFNQDFHVPRMMLDMIQDKKCQVFVTEIDPVTRKRSTKGKLIPEFAIDVLPPLTEKELTKLAQRQAMAAGSTEID